MNRVSATVWRLPRYSMWLGLSVLAAGIALLSLVTGYIDVSPRRLLAGTLIDHDATLSLILFEIRVPRVILSLAVGAALGMAGAAMQGLLRNPLAEPGLLGASSGAALGAVLALYTGFADRFWLALPLAGFVGTALAVGLVVVLAGRKTGTTALILSGVAISALCSSLISLVLNFSPNPSAAMEIVFWMLGSVADRSNKEVALVLPSMLIGAAMLLTCGGGLRALALGEETAFSLGVRLPRLKTQVLLGCALLIGAAVSVAGSVAFIGLIAPHLMRPLVKSDPARLLPASGLAGAMLMTLADIGVRLLYTRGQELKLGVLTAMVGAPFFIFLILKTRRQMP